MYSKKPKTIVARENRERLDVFLAEKLNLTRSKIQKLINSGLVTVNGKKPKKSGDRVKAGNTVIITPKTKTAAKPKTVSAKRTGLKPKVVAETSEYVVINKPSGLLVHPTQAGEPDTLAAWLLKNYPEVKRVGDNPSLRPGIVHRLDKEASGLMVVARTPEMFDHLKNQFKNRSVDKEYLALAHGRVAKDWDTITFPLARGKTSARMAARPVGEVNLARGEKEAKTEFLVEKRFVNFALLRVTIHTGRMHQIRAHLLAYNHPLVGDPLYFQKKRRRVWDEKLGRLFLHSARLAFTDLAGERQVFASPLPEKLKKLLTELS